MTLPDREDVLRRGVEEIIVEREFIERLDSGNPMRLKMGFDPSAPDIHLGHAVGLRKLRQLQELGHKVVLIVGDWTAQIGDPSGRSQTRTMLGADEVNANAQTYLDQFFKIVDRDRTEIRLQSEWFGPFSLTNVIELTRKFTVAQILARDDFAKRFKESQPIAITELLYPLLQAYDSVAIRSDVEFGGSDQRFNLLVGRELQQSEGMPPQQCFIMPLLPGTDGIQKMSKSLDNYIGIDEPPNEIYGKVMSIPDTLIIPYYEWLTDVPSLEIVEIKSALSNGSGNPMELKKRVAGILVADYHDPESAALARSFFERTVQGQEIPDDIQTHSIPRGPGSIGVRLSHIIFDAGLATSTGEARRLIDQGAVRIDDEPVRLNMEVSTLQAGVLRVGRRRYLRLV
ncbi:MAG: tyrosine--tRNA ligase [SAR202 cluster bacterium]|nr:tyrosine--tRNA ligase [SAR202 cluster bacterium]HAE32425.1 tyrosine--tRNA ligase [Dehalococcoidia bacterium]